MDTLRLQARRLEHALDAKLVQFSQHDAPAAASGSSSQDSEEPQHAVTQREIEALLAQLTQVNDNMRRRASEEGRRAAPLV